MVRVWAVDVAAQDLERWRAVLNGGERERAARYRMPADTRRFVVTRGVLRTMLGDYLERPASAIEFRENEHGKPAVDGMQFNVAHSGDWALLAFARDAEVGVDLERVGDEKAVNDLAGRVLSAEEQERFRRVAASERTRTFFQIWTLKEAVLKGMGSGLAVPPEHVAVAFYPDEPRLLAAPGIDVSEWTVRSLAICGADYAAALAVRHRAPVVEARYWAGRLDEGAVPT